MQLPDFLDLFLCRSCYFGACNQTRIDPELLLAFGSPIPYSDEIAAKIDAMDKDAFMAYCRYIIDLSTKTCLEIKANLDLEGVIKHDSRIAIPIIRYIYNHSLIPREATPSVS